MKPIDRKQFVAVGSILKTHGIYGHLLVSSYKQPSEWAFLELQGKPVPFKIISSKPLHNHEYLIKLEGIQTVDQAAPFVQVNLLEHHMGNIDVQSEEDWEGFVLTDTHLGYLGRVENVIEMPLQWLIQTTYQNKELLIPAVSPLLVRIDYTNKTIYTDLPEGLVDTSCA